MAENQLWIKLFGDIDKDPDNMDNYNIIVKNDWNTNREFMILSLRYSYKFKNIHPTILKYMLDNGYPLYDVEVIREILSYSINSMELIDIYINKGLDFNDERLYEAIVIEDHDYSNNNLDKYNIRLIYQPILYFTNSIPLILKIMENKGGGPNNKLDFNRNIYCKEWSSFKKSIDYGNMELVYFYMNYINKDYLQDKEWWKIMLDHVSQNGNVGKGAEKCYEILCKREELLNTDKLPNREIYDIVKMKWCYRVTEDPGEFRV